MIEHKDKIRESQKKHYYLNRESRILNSKLTNIFKKINLVIYKCAYSTLTHKLFVDRVKPIFFIGKSFLFNNMGSLINFPFRRESLLLQ